MAERGAAAAAAAPAKAKCKCTSAAEALVRKMGFVRVAGADEAGRGSLFGPVTAAVVILDPDRIIRGINDSKQLLPEVREELAVRIRERAIAWSVGWADSAEIDRINIYQASRLAIRRALECLQPACDYLLVDALKIDWPVPQESVIHGDAKVRAIAAASILAKVARDARMREYDLEYPGYGLAQHKGYCTPEHVEALRRLGPTSLHRRTFAPVWEAAQLKLCL